jgi:DNA-binding CsgD family transcriptional regulator
MSARDREIVELYHNGISPEEIADIMGLTAARVMAIVEANS